MKLVTLLYSALLWLIANSASGQEPSDRFDPSRSALVQLLEYAKRLGLEQHDITNAIFEGRFNPYLEDLENAFLELPGPSCKDMARNWARNSPTGTQADDQIWFIKKCRDFTLGAKDFSRHIEWNSRFGNIPDRYLFRLSKRTYFENEDPAWSKSAARFEDYSSDTGALEAMDRHRNDSALLYFRWISESADPKALDIGDLAGHYTVYRCFFLKDILGEEVHFYSRECRRAIELHPTPTQEIIDLRGTKSPVGLSHG